MGFDFLYRATSALQFAQGDLAGAAVVIALAVTGATQARALMAARVTV